MFEAVSEAAPQVKNKETAIMDGRLSLALSVQSNPGVYALLLGSGVSRSAKIPTGWEVVLDLIRRIAAMKDEEISGDPAEWYRNRYGDDPDYSRLLGRLARQPAERQRLLRDYFEPSPEERVEGLKQPTAAHRAIANLCKRGYIRVIVTTNFDRLLEQAMSAEGLMPTVISTADAVKGTPPLVHTDLLVLKLHGDYLDTRILNTDGELATYPKPLRDLLDRIFDEYGLIVSGWSARWDPALRAALERCKSQRYTTYWTGIEEPDENLDRLLTLRRAEFLKVNDADEFFTDLNEKVLALEEYARPHPLSLETAAATLKRYLSDPRYDIRYHDLLMQEADRVIRETAGDRFPVGDSVTEATAVSRIRDYESVTEILTTLFATACFWAEERHEAVLTRVIEDLGNQPLLGGNTFLLNLRYYPALLTMYAGGIAAVANGTYGVLRAILLDPQIRGYNMDGPAAVALAKWNVLKEGHAKALPGMAKTNTPLSLWLEARLRDSLRPVIASDRRYISAFDRFEYFWGLVYADVFQSPWGDNKLRGPVGNFVWRWPEQDLPPHEAIEQEIESVGEDWPALRAGFFNRDLARLRAKKEGFDKFWRSVGWW